MFPLNFYYEDVSRQDPLLKLNHADVMEVPRFCKIRVRHPSALINGRKLAMEIPRGQKLFLPYTTLITGYVARQRKRSSTLRGHRMFIFLRISTVISSNVYFKIRENFIKFFTETDYCELSLELEDHFEILEYIRGVHVTIVTSTNTQDETLPPWSGFFN
uniref:Ribosomal protein L5 n=1 Tax=Balanophora laxiflora TaxID=1128103 RepID=A0A3Q9JN80_9MAGN|nr:ribosomal protein L5 [Balanophora laxiflora]UPI49017.1 ribosomal protein L5 [Balanophora laxiflora]